MNRRLFINQVSTGLVLPFLPFSAFSLHSPQEKGILEAYLPSQVAQQIQHGLIGDVQQIAITHFYSPETLRVDSLERTAIQDINTLYALTGLQPLANGQLVTQASPAPLFGSCAVELGTDTLRITWQALAHYGIPGRAVSCQLRVFGSKGIIQTTAGGQNYQIQDLTGHVIQQTATRQTVNIV